MKHQALHPALLLALLSAAMLFSTAARSEAYSCSGRIPNPVTDVSWASIFPIKIGGVTVASYGQEDTGENAPAICACPIPTFPWIRIGMGVSFWEPARVAEVTTTPMCSPLLGGVKMGGNSPLGKKGSAKTGEDQRNSFYQVHWFIFPLTNWMQMLTDTACVAPESFDLMMLSELEPTWADDELAMIFSPEAALFANPVSQAACAADCIAASAGFPLNELFWCAGCQGSMYPMTGNIINHESGIQASLLATQRMHAKLFRAYTSLDMNSKDAMCMPLPLPILPKRSFKTQMLYPIPKTDSSQPYGRSTALWAAGREYPIKGEDFAYLIWRRRVCCAL